MLDIITPSGDRPLQFSLCVEWMKKQTFTGKVNWIIADDSIASHYETPKMPDNWSVTHLKINRLTLPTFSTQSDNILKALENVKNDKIVMVEDDDYYHPSWLETCDKNLNNCDIFGRTRVIFYNISNKTFWDKQYNNGLNPMCQTSFKSTLIPKFKDICSKNTELLDHLLWGLVEDSKKIFLSNNKIEYVIGIKGLSGRGGMSRKHTMIFNNPDPDYYYLKKFIGENALTRYKQYA
jgi:hypothetical protein